MKSCRRLAGDHLAACAHNYAPVRSICRWRGQVRERTGAGCPAHQPQPGRRDRRPRQAGTPCEVPGVSTRPIAGANPGYLTWIAQETSPQRPA
ncbi:MAG: divalent cation tolerance protein CutA [Micromonosporaceae bacterium]